MAKAKILTKDEIKRVLAIIGAGRNAQRNRIAYLMSTEAAMRVGEIAACKIGQVRGIDGKCVEVINLKKEQTKGGSSRRVFLSVTLQQELSKYLLTVKHRGDNDALIASICGDKHFSNVTLCMLFSSWYKAAGIQTSSHSGRRTKATRLNEVGIGMKTIQHVLGHKNIATTALYCDVSDKQLQLAVNTV
jgi:integrase/recombinase XerD